LGSTLGEWGSRCFPKQARLAPSWTTLQDAAMGAGCFDHSRRSPPLARCCGSAGCRALRSLLLSSTDCAPSVEGGLPLVAVAASLGTDRHQSPEFAPVSTGPGER